MLRFIKHNLTSIDGIQFYPLLSLLIFVVFFIVVIAMVIKMSKAEVVELGDLPFEKDEAGEYKQ
jgi:fructose-specific phosphotransferase system IIC component